MSECSCVYVCCTSTITTRKTTDELTVPLSPLALSLSVSVLSTDCSVGKISRVENSGLIPVVLVVVLRQNGSVILATFDRAPF